MSSARKSGRTSFHLVALRFNDWLVPKPIMTSQIPFLLRYRRNPMDLSGNLNTTCPHVAVHHLREHQSGENYNLYMRDSIQPTKHKIREH